MDKRQEKSRNAIYEAFTRLVNEKSYNSITIQEILDASGVGRATFYNHFKTKDDLLLSISNDIFSHVFSHTLQEEKSHDFSKDKFFDFKHLITHILYHLRDENELIKGILTSEGNTVFLEELRKHLAQFSDLYYNNYPYSSSTPIELKKAVLVENFIVVLKYWISEDFCENPESITEYFISLM